MAARRTSGSSPNNTNSSSFPRNTFASPAMPSTNTHTDFFSSGPGSGSQFPLGSSRNDRKGPDYTNEPQIPLSTSDPTQLNHDARSQPVPTILLRRLPRNIGNEILHSMLLFAKDLIGAEFVASKYPEDAAYSCAIAQFKSLPSALEAKERLSGKPNATNDATMLVEVMQAGLSSRFGSRRNTIDAAAARQQSGSNSSDGSPNEPLHRQTSRFNGTFQSIENVSPPQTLASHINGDFPIPEANHHFQNLFSPQSPVGNSLGDQQRISGKSVINDDAVDDETGELLRDPLAYARNGHQQTARRPTNPQIPTASFGALTLGTTMSNGSNPTSNAGSSLPSSRSLSNHQSPGSVLSPGSQSTMSPGGSFNSNYSRHNYPPANPADQNPPCNTLYVGNLPIDTNEDELKALFSKQRGYKRLCFRTKQNGPMCFVEFEDVSFATKALHELYGYLLHNSVKGGIRLSFSKNPLGVRTGQMNGMGGPSSPMSPQALSPGFGNGVAPPPGFPSSGAPPPGLAGPGRGPSYGSSHLPDGMNSAYMMSSFGGMGHMSLGAQMRAPPVSTGYAPSSSGAAVGGMSSGYGR